MSSFVMTDRSLLGSSCPSTRQVRQFLNRRHQRLRVLGVEDGDEGKGAIAIRVDGRTHSIGILGNVFEGAEQYRLLEIGECDVIQCTDETASPRSG